MGLATEPWSCPPALRLGALLAVGGVSLGTGPALGQQDSSVDELAAQATDPTASLMSFQLNDWYTANFTASMTRSIRSCSAPRSRSRSASTKHIFRVTQPYVTTSPSGATGFADTTIFDLVVFGAPWGRWGVGISGTLPTGQDGLTTDKWTAGPALGFVNSSDKESTGACSRRRSSRLRARTARRTSA